MYNILSGLARFLCIVLYPAILPVNPNPKHEATMNVLQLAATVQRMWEDNAAESFNSYKPNSTWASDLAIAMYYKKNDPAKADPVMKTVTDALNNWKNEPGYHHLIMLGCAINFMSWICAANAEWNQFTDYFSDLYYWYCDEVDKIDEHIYGMIHHYLD